MDEGVIAVKIKYEDVSHSRPEAIKAIVRPLTEGVLGESCREGQGRLAAAVNVKGEYNMKLYTSREICLVI